MSNDYILTLTHAVERDIDLLLVEELQCDLEFVQWLLSLSSAKTISPNRVAVAHSKRRTFERREIDIETKIYEIGNVNPKAILLIENKIDEKEQPGQGLSYRDEKALLMAQEGGRPVITMLLCPEAYARAWPGFVAHFDALVSYEAIEGFFRTRATRHAGEIAARMDHRARLISQAITKERRGYQPIPISSIGSFNDCYRALLAELSSDIFPGSGLRRPGDKPSDSVSMIFDCKRSFAGLDRRIIPTRFAHELGRGKVHRANYVNVQFRGFDRGFERLEQREKDDLKQLGLHAEVKLDRRSGKKILKLMMSTPAVDNQKPFNQVEADVKKGIEAAIRLRKWCFDRRQLLLDIARSSKDSA